MKYALRYDNGSGYMEWATGGLNSISACQTPALLKSVNWASAIDIVEAIPNTKGKGWREGRVVKVLRR